MPSLIPPNTCHHCSRQFGSPTTLQKHYTTSPSHSFCVKCTTHFPSPTHLIIHITTSPQHYYCYSCRLDFPSEPALGKHYQSSSRHYYCAICSELFLHDQSLRLHIETLHHACWPCQTYFRELRDLKEHWRDGAGKKAGMEHRSRGTCSEGFKNDEELCLHLSSAREHFWCLGCRKDCKSEERLFKVLVSRFPCFVY